MSMFAGASKVAMIVAGGYLVVFFALASGVVNASIEGAGAQQFILPYRSIQTLGETVAITFILFIGLAGAILLHRSGKVFTPKSQQAYLAAGFSVVAIALFLGYLLVGLKL
ncbi:hypothetical protein [Nitrososphaera sp.]|uniref:hypothetical protein n=1 Tax=Nitrososphaera sp. TaxID=1971748 RepID=UPI00307E54D2